MKLNKSMIARARQYSAEFKTIKQLCDALGITRTTYYDWKDKGENQDNGIYRDFVDAINEGHDEFMDNLEHNCLARIIRADSWQSDAWILERLMPEKYARTNIRPYSNGDNLADGVQKVLVQIEGAAESISENAEIS